MNLKEIEDFYPLSPLQEGMLFHSLYAPEVGAYINTFSNGLQGDLNVSAFQHAWQNVVNRHQALRSIFVKDGLKQPLQFVYRQVTLPWEVHDWRESSPSDRQHQLDAFLLADRARGFDLSKPPLMRFALLRMGDDLWHFVWTFHHILLDGWCLSLLLREVFAFYEAYTRGEQLQLPRPRPYRDYIRWLQRQDLGAAETYWRKRLKGLASPTRLELGEQRQSQNANGYGERNREISEQTSRAIETLARQQQVTVNTVIQGAWAVLMSRYSGERDVVYGITVAGRPAELPGVEQMVGLFINALPLRVQVESDAEVGRWLQRLQAEQAEMRQYEYSPLVAVQGWSELERGVGLFETLLAYENFPTLQASAGGAKAASVSLSVTQGRNLERTNYPLSVVVTPGVCMSVRAMYEEHKFNADTVDRMLRHFEQLLAGMAANAQQHLSELRLLTEAEERQLLGDWNATQTDYPQDSCVHQLIEAQVSRTPDAIAVVAGDEQITYAELNGKANQLAHHLQSLGVGPDMLVGICVERSVEMLVGLLGIWKAGAAYVALDPSYPQERLALMLREAHVPALLTQQKLLPVLPEHTAQVVCLDSDWPTISRRSELTPGVQVSNNNLAYVIYTSGSTGTPKGAGVYHQGLVNTFNWFINDFQITAADRILLMTSLSFDLTQKNIFTPLMTGGTLYLTPVESGYDPALIADLVCEHEITLLNCTPSAFYPLIDNGDYDSLIKLVSLRHLFLGGEPISLQRLSSWTEFFEFHTSIVNTYGPTECTDIVASYRLDAQPSEDATVPIGKPIFNAELYVMDQDLNLLPVGVAGELCIGGDGVGAGYINDSRLTAAKFVPHPFSSTPGARIYRTGDRARYLPDGNIEFLGRSDHQVKVRGFRIEIGEIEAALNEYPAVRESVVVAKDETSGDKRLVAYVVTDEERLGSNELRKYLVERIPEYMVPSTFVQLDQLPLTPNGKVDRQALLSFEETVSNEPESEVAGARNPVEELLIGIWGEVLGVKQLGISDNFFELGGHSLVATQVISRISETFKIELPFRAFFDAPTIEGLAIYVENALRSQHAIEAPPLAPVSRDESLPLSFSQQRLWFLDQLEPMSNAYNIPSVVRLRGLFIPEVFKRAVEEVMRRHESLRTRFLSDEGRAWQQIDEAAELSVPIIDLRSYPEAEQDQEVRRLATLEVQKPFDLTHGPLLRLTVLQLAENEHVLLLTMHHIVSDGWSMTVLMRELIVLYDAFSRGESSPLPELPIQYADYAVWQREWLQGEVLEQQMKYWREQLQGAPPVLELPTDHPRPAVQSLRGRMLQRRMSGELLQQLEALSRREGLTMYMSVLAAFVVVLSRYSGQREIVVGTPIAGRTRRDIEGLIGFFVNTLVLRMRVDEQQSVRQLLERVRETCLGGYTHQDVAFEQLVEELQPERDLSHQPVFQVMFALEGGGDEQGWKIGDLQVELEEVESGVAKFDLTLRVKQGHAGWELAMEYKQDLYEEATIACMLEHVERVLEGMAGDVRQPVSELSLLSTAEREHLLGQWNETDRAYADDVCVQQLFEARAAARPEAVALICDGDQVSYGELNRRSNQLARYLRALGVGPEVVVGLCVERSVEMVVGLLGILKAGGAYLPLDPEYPQERLSFMLDDAGVFVVITQERLVDKVTAVQTVSIDGDWSRIAEGSADNLHPAASSANLAYVIYTSGSTGTPKGVMLNHKGLTNRTLTMIDQYGIESSDRQFQFISLSFDASVEEIFPTLCRGAALVLRRNIKELSAAGLISECGRLGVTKMDLPVSYWHQMADELSQSGSSVPQSIRTIVVGGDSPSTEKAKAFVSTVHHPMRVFNAYGPTEATVLTTLYEMPLNQDQLDVLGKIPIGRPINNTRLYILDRDLKVVPARVFGELYIGGEGLARGYLNRPDFSAEKFIPNPFSEEPGARLYRTGDIARYLPNGDIEFGGRIDQQVKVRGFRIELSEIENLLLGHPSITTAAVSIQERGSDKGLVAYIVPQAGVVVSTSELRRYLQKRLPEYMVPSVYVTLAELPLTPNGKVDRKSLPAPAGVQPEFEHEYVRPQTEIEEVLAGIWAKMLGVERVGIHDNFFELGGDSILSIQVISRANQAGLRLSPKDLFQHQTVAKLAAIAGTAAEIVAEQGLVMGPVALTPVQHWFFEQELSEPHHFNQSLLLEVRQAIDAAVLAEAVRRIVLHHDALRLRFTRTASGWQQSHTADEQVSFTRFDLSAVADQSAAIEREAAAVQASLNLSDGPLLRVVYFDLGAEQPGRLLLVCHHLVVDGVSWRILLADLQEAYRALLAGETVQLPVKSSSFQQWSQALQEYAKSDAVQEQLSYWLSAEREQVQSLPRDYDGENLVSSTAVVVENLSRRETEALLQEVPGVYHTQINEVLLSGLALTLGEWTKQALVLVDVEGHGREPISERVDVSRTVGWFTTIYPVLLEIGRREAVGEVVKQVKEQVRGIPGQGLGYGVLRYLGSEAGERLQAMPQAEVSFNYLGQMDRVLSEDTIFGVATESSGPYRGAFGRRMYLVEINAMVVGGQLQVSWSYSNQVHERETIASLAAAYVRNLRAIIEHCASEEAGGYTPSDFPLAQLDNDKLEKLSLLLKDIDNAVLTQNL